MTRDWAYEPVGACLERINLPNGPKLLTRDYQPHGKYPVIDQSQAQVAAWTDRCDAVISDVLPVIVFGDHTRTLKYVDFPFVRGADGTQILKPRVEIDPLYFYYACRSLNLVSRGYNRHLSLLKEQVIPLPGLPEQGCIARALRMLEDYEAHQVSQLSVADELKRNAMERIFRLGPTGGAQVETSIGLLPKGWVHEQLSEHHTVQTGATPARGNPRYWEGGTIPWVKTAEVSYTTILETSEYITQAALFETNVRLFPVGTLLLALYGQGVTRGKVAKLGVEATCNQACAAIQSPDGAVDPDYLYRFLEWQYDSIRTLAHGGQQQNLNLDIVREIPIAYPANFAEQRAIAAIVESIDAKLDVHRSRVRIVRELFERLMRDLMSGEVTVADLDLAALPADVSRRAGALA